MEMAFAQFVSKIKDLKYQQLVDILIVGDAYSIFMIELMEEFHVPSAGCKSQQSSNALMKGKE